MFSLKAITHCHELRPILKYTTIVQMHAWNENQARKESMRDRLVIVKGPSRRLLQQVEGFTTNRNCKLEFTKFARLIIKKMLSFILKEDDINILLHKDINVVYFFLWYSSCFFSRSQWTLNQRLSCDKFNNVFVLTFRTLILVVAVLVEILFCW